jgi:AraC-like DNA-binding protein
MVVGQMSGWIRVSTAKRIDLLGIRFRPAGAFPFLRLPAVECAGATIDAHAISPAIAEAAGRASSETSTSGRLSVIETALLQLLGRHEREADAAVGEAVRLILQRHGNVGIEGLAERLALHPRALERRFARHVGLSPKLLARITRFQHVFRAFDSGDDGWARVATHCGYYDQSHLLRDFRQFAGESPALLAAHEIPLTRAFLRANRLSEFSYTDGVSDG